MPPEWRGPVVLGSLQMSREGHLIPLNPSWSKRPGGAPPGERAEFACLHLSFSNCPTVVDLAKAAV